MDQQFSKTKQNKQQLNEQNKTCQMLINNVKKEKHTPRGELDMRATGNQAGLGILQAAPTDKRGSDRAYLA